MATTSIDFSLKDADPRSKLSFYQSSNRNGPALPRPAGAFSSQSLPGSSPLRIDGEADGGETGGGLETFRMRVETVSPLLNEQYQVGGLARMHLF